MPGGRAERPVTQAGYHAPQSAHWSGMMLKLAHFTWPLTKPRLEPPL